jgi:hypothetical protein
MFVGCCRARGFVISLLAGQAYPAIYKGSELVETISAKSGDYGAVADEFVSVLSRSIDLSSEQATKFEQINKAIGEISHIVQANSSCAEEAAAAVEEMTAQSEGMTYLKPVFIDLKMVVEEPEIESRFEAGPVFDYISANRV